MPGMRLFGKRCALATDDFLFIGLIDSIIFLPWLGWIPVVYASFLKQRSVCEVEPSLYLMDVSLPGLCVLFFSNWLLAALFVIFSVKGTISQPEPRRHVVTLVYVKLFISTLDAAWATLGTVILVRNSFCDIIGIQLVIKVTTIFLWLATLVRVGMIIFFYDWSSSKNTKERVQKEYFTAPVRVGTFKRWNLRFHAFFLWCTTASEARKEAIKTASELMALLSCDLDLVASDVFAGLLLYRQKCLQKWKSEKHALNAEFPITLADGGKLQQFPPENFPAWMNLQLANRYLNIGLGVFGWPWFMYRNFACGCCLLFRRLTCCFSFRKRSNIVYGDNCCGCNLAGLESTTCLPYDDLVHVSFVDRIFEVPFFVTYDHETSSILITARGTMSVDDILTDVAAGFANMDDPGCPSGALCHGGILNAAREIKRKIDENDILELAFKERPNYHLVTTGHSLGAAVASILALLFKSSYPNVRCFAFAPPPMMNKIALPLTFDTVFTIIYGNDSVVYLNYENIQCMVNEMVKCLEECDLPKYKVLLNKKTDHEIEDADENCCSAAVDPKSNGKVKMSAGKNSIIRKNSDIENGSNATRPVTESLYVAGKILHLRKSDNGYRLRVSIADDFKPLVFRPNMVRYHFPQFVQHCLEKLGQTPVLESSSLALTQK